MTKYKIITFTIIFVCLIVIGVSLKKIFFNNPLTSAEQNLVKIHKDIYAAKQISLTGQATSTGSKTSFDIYLDEETGDYSYKIYNNDSITEGYLKKGNEAYSLYSGGKWIARDSGIGASMLPILRTTIATNLLQSMSVKKDDEHNKVSLNSLKGTTQIKTNQLFTNLIRMLSMYQSGDAGLNEDTTMTVSQDLKGNIKELLIESKILDPMQAETQITITLKDLNVKKDVELPKPEEIEQQPASQIDQTQLQMQAQ